MRVEREKQRKMYLVKLESNHWGPDYASDSVLHVMSGFSRLTSGVRREGCRPAHRGTLRSPAEAALVTLSLC